MPGQYTSTQITEQLRHSTNVVADKQAMFEKVRYFVAQKPARIKALHTASRRMANSRL